MTDAEWAYFAGILDGEGSIYASASVPSKQPSGKVYVCCQTTLTVSNSDRRLIDWIDERLMGNTAEYTPAQTPKNARKKVFKWYCNGENMVAALKGALPFLVVKKRQAELMLELRATFQGGRGSKALTDEERAHREHLVQLIKAENQR